MSYEIKPFNPSEWPEGLDELLAVTQDDAVQMLPLTAEQIMQHAGHTGAYNEMGKVVGYAAITAKYQGYTIGEIGGLVVAKADRRHGLGHGLVKAVTQLAVVQGIKPIAFCNSLSAPLFESCGYRPVEPLCIPGEALELCIDCKSKPDDGGCCDTVYALPSETEVTL